jgi:diguanylate cyclase (GGDEF)-like protein
MPKQKVDLRSVFQPSDSIIFLVIAVGLFIAIYLDEMAVRLIGICISILGGVALFMIVSPRLTDLQIIAPIRPSQTPDLGSRIVTDGKKTSQTFDPDAYRNSFGLTEGGDPSFVDEKQIDLFEGHTDLVQHPAIEPPAPVVVRPVTAPAARPQQFIEHTDSESSIRILGTKKSKSATAPKLVSELRQENRKNAELSAELSPEASIEEATFSSTTAMITGPVTDEIQLSEDIIVRPRSKSRATPPPPPPPTVEEQPETTEADLSESVDTGSELISSAPSNEVAEPVEDIVAEEIVDEQPEERIEEPAEPVRTGDDISDLVSETSKPRETSRRSPAVSLATFVNDDEEDLTSQEPRREFDFLLNRVLMVIRSATNARTAAFLWVNSERQQLVVEAKITEAESEFTPERKIPMGSDAVSQIAREGRPEIITQISSTAELDLLPYYVKSAQTVSFIGVPVYYGGSVVGILCADSKIEDAYSDITVGFFGQFTKLISGLVSSYTTRYDLMQASSVVEATRQFREHMGGTPSNTQQIVRALFATLIQHMDISRIGVVTFNREAGAWTLTDARSALDDGYRQNVGATVDLVTTAVGESINSAATVVRSADDEGTRVLANEPSLEVGQFVSVPLSTALESYGALFIENVVAPLAQQEVALAAAIAEQAGALFDQLRKEDDLRTAALLDHGTGVLNEQGFEMRVREEFARAVDYNLPLTLCIVHLDPSRASAEQREHAVLHILRMMKQQLREYDILARLDADHLALGLVGYKSQEAHNWTETMRRDIASTPVDVEGKRMSFTVSIGLAQAEPRETWDDLIAHANAALEVSRRSGNRVTVFA